MEKCSFKVPVRKNYKRQSAAEANAAREVTAWNESVPVGTEVCVHKDNGETVTTKTRSVASVVGGSACAWFEGISGCYTVDRAHLPEASK